jgi:hypothetical protein
MAQFPLLKNDWPAVKISRTDGYEPFHSSTPSFSVLRLVNYWLIFQYGGLDLCESIKSPLPPLFQRGEFLPLARGGKEGFYLACRYNYGLLNNK